MPDSDDDFQFLGFDQYFSSVPAATTPLAGTEPMLVFQGGTTKQVSSSNVGRPRLTGPSNFYISALGSDSNPGTISQPWATTQHAMDFLASDIDFAGQNVTVNIGAGSFAGFGVKSTVGGGNLLWRGTGSSTTTITAGPNDGVFNFGENVTFNSVPSGTTHYFAGLKFSNPSAFGHFAIYVPYPAIQWANLDGSAVDIAFVGTTGLPILFLNSPCDVVINGFSPINVDRTGAPALDGEISVVGSATIILISHIKVIGNPTYNFGGIFAADGAVLECAGFFFIGSFTGNAATSSAAVIDSAGSLLSSTIAVEQGGIIT